jgi:hypothetical protein
MNREFGSKTGKGAPLSETQANVDRRERLRLLALETIDLAKVCRAILCPIACCSAVACYRRLTFNLAGPLLHEEPSGIL